MTLREDLADWCEWDEAAAAYGAAIGVFTEATGRDVNRIVLGDNPLGDGLHAGMMALVEAGVLEHREEPSEQFRWVFSGRASFPSAMGAEQDPTPEPRRAHSAPAPVADPAPKRWWQRG